MYDTKDIRRSNMRLLATNIGGITYLADKLSKSQSQISQLIGKSPSKNIGDRIARQAEAIFEKPRGWMDVLHHHVEETITAYELVINTAPHRAIPFIKLKASDINHPINELARNSEHDHLIPGSAKLSEQAFALALQDIDTHKCLPFALPAHTIMIVDPAKPIYHGAYVLVRNHHTNKLTLRQASVEGKKIHLKTENDQQIPEEFLASDSNYGVVRQILLNLE